MEAGGEELRADHLEVLSYLQDPRLGVKVVNSRHQVTARCDAECGVLNGLELIYGRITGVTREVHCALGTMAAAWWRHGLCA